MKILKYYFTKEYQWYKKWFSDDGNLGVKIMPSQEFIDKHGWIDYEILSYVFVLNPKMKKVVFINELINEIELVLLGHQDLYRLFNETVELNIKKYSSRLIDNLGDDEGIEAPLSWNMSTPKQFQYIPTPEILELIKDWKEFLILNDSK